MWNLSSPIRDLTCGPLHCKADSQPLGHQGSPSVFYVTGVLNKYYRHMAQNSEEDTKGVKWRGSLLPISVSQESLSPCLTRCHLYRQISFYCALQTVGFFFGGGGNWRLTTALCWASLLVSSFQLCLSHFMSLCHLGNFHNISNFPLLLYLLLWSVIRDLWCYYCKKTITCWRVRWCSAYFWNKVFFF